MSPIDVNYVVVFEGEKLLSSTFYLICVLCVPLVMGLSGNISLRIDSGYWHFIRKSCFEFITFREFVWFWKGKKCHQRYSVWHSKENCKYDGLLLHFFCGANAEPFSVWVFFQSSMNMNIFHSSLYVWQFDKNSYHECPLYPSKVFHQFYDEKNRLCLVNFGVSFFAAVADKCGQKYDRIMWESRFVKFNFNGFFVGGTL